MLLVSQVGLMAFAQPKIVINHAWWGGNPSNFYDAAKKEFEAENPGVQVDLVSGYKDAMVVHCAAGTMDTMVMDSVFFGEFLQQGMLAPITPLLEADAQMRRDLEKDFWPGSYVWATYKGTLYALPYLWTQSQVLFYNKDRFAESGLPTPPVSNLGGYDTAAAGIIRKGRSVWHPVSPDMERHPRAIAVQRWWLL